jgi:hypothetical protein
MKSISIVMSFIAIFAAASVLGIVVYSNKGYNRENQNVVSNYNEPKVSSVDTAIIQKAYVLGEVKPAADPPNIIPPPQTPPDHPPAIQDVPPQPLQPLVGPNLPQPAPVNATLYTPNSSVVFAFGDLQTIPLEQQPYIRYLSLYNIPKAKRKDYAAVLSFMVNSLSTRRKIYIPEFVGASDETLIRLNIANYEWNPKVWDNLGLKGSGPKPEPEPYFHYLVDKPIVEKIKVKKTITETIPWKDEYGRQYVDQKTGKGMTKEVKKEVEVEEVVANKRKIHVDIAPWLDPLANSGLYTLTGSQFPILRGDWFLANVSLAPAYYDFLKLGKNIKDFEKLIFADDDLAKKARSQDKGVVVTSMVARNNRTLLRSPTFTGGYSWESHDTLKSVDDRDYVKFLLNEKFDATEDIGSLPNGLQAYFLTDGKGNRLDEANIEIAVDNTANDRIVRNGRSCIVCHSDGIRPLTDEVRSLTRKLQDPKQVQLLIPRKEDAYKIEDLFGSDLDEQIIKDQNYYRAAVARATGLQSEVLSRVFNEVYNYYQENLLTIETVSSEVGVEIKDLDVFIKASKDNIVLGLLKTPSRPIRRDQWEFAFGRFMILIQARKQGLDHADQFPPGPLISTPK